MTATSVAIRSKTRILGMDQVLETRKNIPPNKKTKKTTENWPRFIKTWQIKDSTSPKTNPVKSLKLKAINETVAFFVPLFRLCPIKSTLSEKPMLAPFI